MQKSINKSFGNYSKISKNRKIRVASFLSKDIEGNHYLSQVYNLQLNIVINSQITSLLKQNSFVIK